MIKRYWTKVVKSIVISVHWYSNDKDTYNSSLFKSYSFLSVKGNSKSYLFRSGNYQIVVGVNRSLATKCYVGLRASYSIVIHNIVW